MTNTWPTATSPTARLQGKQGEAPIGARNYPKCFSIFCAGLPQAEKTSHCSHCCCCLLSRLTSLEVASMPRLRSDRGSSRRKKPSDNNRKSDRGSRSSSLSSPRELHRSIVSFWGSPTGKRRLKITAQATQQKRNWDAPYLLRPRLIASRIS